MDPPVQRLQMQEDCAHAEGLREEVRRLGEGAGREGRGVIANG